MSTRGIYTFEDSDYILHVFKHSDNYPEGPYGGIASIKRALDYAWPLPRFEADEFAAGFVAANKDSPGEVRLINYDSDDYAEEINMDQEYNYWISMKGKQLYIKVYDSDNLKVPIAEGTLKEMIQHFEVEG